MKKKLLFTANYLNIGGIEKALVNLLDNIDYEKYEVTLILEKKEGDLLDNINKNVIVKEIKVSNCRFSLIRKIINFLRKLKFRLFNNKKYDFSCCYATYSYSGNKLALIGSNNSMLYVHSNYVDLYKKSESRIHEFFDSRNIDKFKYITFVSNESQKDFLKYYPDLKDKTKVFNNFIDVDNIIIKSADVVKEDKPKDSKLLVFVGRLDDSSKKLGRAINLVRQISNINLWIIGDGKDKQLYKELVEGYNLEEKVKFLGQKENPYPYIKMADYVILTSDYEGFPVIYLEALVLNTSIITTIKVSDDLIDISKNAFIISKDDKKIVNDVEQALKSEKKKNAIDIKEIQKERIKELEKIFDEE